MLFFQSTPYFYEGYFSRVLLACVRLGKGQTLMLFFQSTPYLYEGYFRRVLLACVRLGKGHILTLFFQSTPHFYENNFGRVPHFSFLEEIGKESQQRRANWTDRRIDRQTEGRRGPAVYEVSTFPAKCLVKSEQWDGKHFKGSDCFNFSVNSFVKTIAYCCWCFDLSKRCLYFCNID